MSLRKSTGELLHRLPMTWHRILPPKSRKKARHFFGRYGTWELSFDHTPPRLRPGESTGNPDFVGIGAQKAGTSWWFDLIAEHPGVHFSPKGEKEVQYLSRFATRDFGPAEEEVYRGWFPRTEATIAGEWTADYLHLPWVPQILHAMAPDTKILLAVRDPVERFRSGLAHSYNAAEEEHVQPLIVNAYNRGLYATCLRRWLEFFDESQIHVVQYEANLADPMAEIARTYEFLGLDPDFRPEDVRRYVNKTPVRKMELGPDARRRLIEVFAPDVAELTARFKHIDLSLWPNFSGQA